MPVSTESIFARHWACAETGRDRILADVSLPGKEQLHLPALWRGKHGVRNRRLWPPRKWWLPGQVAVNQTIKLAQLCGLHLALHCLQLRCPVASAQNRPNYGATLATLEATFGESCRSRICNPLISNSRGLITRRVVVSHGQKRAAFGFAGRRWSVQLVFGVVCRGGKLEFIICELV